LPSAFRRQPATDTAHYNGFLLGYAGIKPHEANALVARLATMMRGLVCEYARQA